MNWSFATTPLAKSVGLHVLIVACMMISVSFSVDPLSMPAQTMPVIEATFIDAQAIADKKRAEEQAVAQQRERERQTEKKRQQARAAAEKKKRQKAEKKRQQELKRKAAEEVRKKRQREEAKKAEAERKKREAEEKAALEKIQREQLAAEQAAQQARRSRQVLSEVDKYRALIYSTIKRFLIEDPAFKGKRCRLNVRLASTGLVTQVTIKDGDPALCRASQSAVLKPDKLPVSSDPDVFEELRNINLTVEL